jgi:hypothetical protein
LEGALRLLAAASLGVLLLIGVYHQFDFDPGGGIFGGEER